MDVISASSRQYGSTNISDKAVVHLGDNLTNFTITNATFVHNLHTELRDAHRETTAAESRAQAAEERLAASATSTLALEAKVKEWEGKIVSLQTQNLELKQKALAKNNTAMQQQAKLADKDPPGSTLFNFRFYKLIDRYHKAIQCAAQIALFYTEELDEHSGECCYYSQLSEPDLRNIQSRIERVRIYNKQFYSEVGFQTGWPSSQPFKLLTQAEYLFSQAEEHVEMYAGICNGAVSCGTSTDYHDRIVWRYSHQVSSAGMKQFEQYLVRLPTTHNPGTLITAKKELEYRRGAEGTEFRSIDEMAEILSSIIISLAHGTSSLYDIKLLTPILPMLLANPKRDFNTSLDWPLSEAGTVVPFPGFLMSK